MSKSLKLLELYTRLENGEKFSKIEMAELAGGVSERTVQRYISTINSFLTEQHTKSEIKYDQALNPYLSLLIIFESASKISLLWYNY